MLKGFRDFILRGNVIDLAVAVVIGAAFTALVNAFAKGFIEPLVRVVLGGSTDNIGGTLTINGQVIDFALMINAAITFVITAAVVYFIFVLPMNAYRERTAKGKETMEEMEAAEVALLKEIRDLLAGQPPKATGAEQGQPES